MKRLLGHIAIILSLALCAEAQVLSPVGSGLDYTPLKTTVHNNGLAVVYVDEEQKVKVDVWNGDFWYTTEDLPLPAYGSNAYGFLEIRDLQSFNGKLYLLAEHSLDMGELAPNYVLEWNGFLWRDISNGAINNALNLSYLIYQDNKIHCIGIFNDTSAKTYNMAVYEGNAWNLKGNLITRNLYDDRFRDVVVKNDKVYVTGKFTVPSIGPISLAEWDGYQWVKTEFPPFLEHNSTLGLYEGSLVVYGNSSLSEEVVKKQIGSAWENMSQGLENYTVNGVDDFVEKESVLYMVGDFVHNTDQSQINVLEYRNSIWQPTLLPLNGVKDAHVLNEQLILSGDFSDQGRVKNIGFLLQDRAQIQARVFHDKNSNCVKDQDEEWLISYPLILDHRVDNLLSDRDGRVYLEVMLGERSLNASTYNYWQPTCPDKMVQATETKVYKDYVFGVRKQSGIRDAVVHTSDNQSYRHLKGERKKVQLCAENLGSEMIHNARLELVHDNSISQFNAELDFDSYVDNKAIWIISEIAPESKQCFYVSFNAVSDESFEMEANVFLDPSEIDANEENNRSVIQYKKGDTKNNAKHCNNGTAILEDEDYLHYKIGFKNEGASKAFDIKIVDELDEDIVPDSLVFRHSHKCSLLESTYRELPNSKYRFKYVWGYQDINLPSAQEDEEASEGFLDFKVYLRKDEDYRLKKGDEICNTALIYYSYRKGSYNEPIATNTVCSSVTDNLGVSPILPLSGLSIAPNPASGMVEMNNKQGSELKIRISNVLGQDFMQSFIPAHSQNTLDISSLAPGIYFIYANGYFAQKLIVQ